MADDLEYLSAIEQEYPLASAVLWRCESAPWDQRRSVIAAMESERVTVITGGERSGKSVGCKELTVANALGGDHPAVVAWCELNDLPRHRIPDGPGKVYALALDSNASLRYHRMDFDALVGPSRWWHNRDGKGEARLYLPVHGYQRPGEIWFKGVDQGPDAMQGDSIRWWWIDEEPHTAKGRLVYGQLKARAMDQAGRGAITMVPMSGYTWVHDDLIRDGKDGAVVAALDSLDNPHLPRESAESHFESMDEEERAVRRFGQWRSRTGAMYPRWTPSDGKRDGMGHTCEPFEIPDDWIRFRGADFGLDNPTAVLWGALGDDDTLYIYREYYQAKGASYRWHAENVARLEGWDEVVDENGDTQFVRGERTEPIEGGWGDPAAREGRIAFATCNVGVAPANNDVKGGCDRVRERLRQRGDNRPRLKVFTTCRWTVREMGGYSIDPNRKDEAPLKKDDHTCDALRYLVMGIASWKGIV